MMAIFRVGQKVRIVRATLTPSLLGAEAIISRPYGLYYGRTNGWRDCYIIAVAGDGEYCATPEELEPIQPERNRVVAWEDCPWQPNRELVS